jgi:hypothetical protein
MSQIAANDRKLLSATQSDARSLGDATQCSFLHDFLQKGLKPNKKQFPHARKKILKV